MLENFDIEKFLFFVIVDWYLFFDYEKFFVISCFWVFLIFMLDYCYGILCNLWNFNMIDVEKF